MKRLVLLVLLIVAPVFGQSVDLSIKGDGVTVVKVDRVIVVKEDLTVVKSFPFTVNAGPGAGLYFWTFPAGVQAIDAGDSLRVTDAPKGAALTISVKSISAKLDKDGKFIGFLTQFGTVSFAIGDAPPGPTPEPSPTPEPKPPVPPSPAPIPVAGYRVLIVMESAEVNKLTKGQAAAIYGEGTREWLLSKVVKAGSVPELRIYDKDQSLAGESKLWKEAMARQRTSLPWLIVSNGVSGFEGPLPVSLPEILNILQKYAPKE